MTCSATTRCDARQHNAHFVALLEKSNKSKDASVVIRTNVKLDFSLQLTSLVNDFVTSSFIFQLFFFLIRHALQICPLSLESLEYVPQNTSLFVEAK